MTTVTRKRLSTKGILLTVLAVVVIATVLAMVFYSGSHSGADVLSP